MIAQDNADDTSAVTNNNQRPNSTPENQTTVNIPSQISQNSTRSIIAPISSQPQKETKYIMVADIASAKIFANIMQCISSDKKKEDAWVMCEIMDEGIKFYIEDNKALQGVAIMKKDIFQSYTYKGKPGAKYQFEINVQILIHCLVLYGANSSQGTIVKLCYPGVDSTLSLLLGEERVVTDCNIRIRNCGDPIDFHFKDMTETAKIVLKSEVLADALSEIDWLSKTMEIGVEVEELNQEVNIDPNLQKGKIFFKTVDNVIGSMEIIIPSTNEGVDSFKSSLTQMSAFRLSHVRQAMKALPHADKVCLRMNDQGLLCWQFAIRATEPVTYVEYVILPVDTEMEDDSTSSF